MELIRPTTIEDMRERMDRFRSPQARAVVDEFVVQPGDVFVATYSKSGTTWMQQVVHQLRTGGDTGFAEISAVVPWIETALDMNIDPAAPQAGPFRVFKSHLPRSELPDGARYITVFRDPLTVLPSFYNFMEGWWFEPGSVTLEEFAAAFYLAGTESGWHWDHFVDWADRLGGDTLALAYEDMLLAPDEVPRVVADFLDLDLPAEVMRRVVEYCSRDYMARNVRQFDDHLMRQICDPGWGLPPGGSSAKVNARSRKLELSSAILARLTQNWREGVTARTGFADYQAFRSSLPNHLGVDRSV